MMNSEEVQAAPEVQEATPDVPEGNGLFDSVQPVAEGEPSQAQPEGQPSEWQWAEGVNGQGDKPEWLQGRYKSVSEQAKAYTELEKRLGEIKGAPKDGYDFESMEGVAKDDPLLQHFSETFKELNLSQAGFERVANEFAQIQTAMNKEQTAEELKKLGPNATQVVSQASNWIDNTFNPEVSQTIKSWMGTAEDINALNAIMAFQPKSNVPSSEGYGAQQPEYETSKTVINEKTQNWGKYQEDVNYRTSVQNRLQNAMKREEQRKK